ncbi:MAG: multicopper oxidase domain-containing protein [Deltaproteobacteria bacterium]|nr:multicopper oxidase domain-containing protein [Deltaproteobacteria bacterium]
MFIAGKGSRRRRLEAEAVRRDRQEILAAWSSGRVSRRDLVRWGLLSAGGLLLQGLSPLARPARADVPTGTPPSPVPPGLAFTQPMPRLEEFQRTALSALDPGPTRESNQTFNAAKGLGPIEGRPPGPLWAHQRWGEFFPRVAVEASQRPLLPGYRFHPALPEIRPERMWTFDGTLPLRLLKARYGEPMLFRHHNRLPTSPAENGGFGRNTLTTHLHNGHTPAESDGYTSAFFWPGQFYDYRWPMALAGHDTVNRDAEDSRAGMPGDDGGIVRVPGDWREIQSSLWFHDHMVDFTSQNVYKGCAATLNLYSSVDRGNEEIEDGVNLRLPSGTAQPWGNTDYDVNLMLADKALDASGQLFFDVFDRDGFLGDVMTVNAAYLPYLEVERRRYRFRILNGSVARFYKLALSDGSRFQLIGNDGNLLDHPLSMSVTDELGVAERFDVVIDFARYRAGDRIWLVNLCEHDDGRGPKRNRSLPEALAGRSPDPCVGRVLELRIARDPPRPDASRVPSRLIPLPERRPAVRERVFEFGRSSGTEENPWTIKVNDGRGLAADTGRISAAPVPGTAEIWHLVNGGGGWDHPIHIHFEEGQTLARNGATPPPWERFARKDVWRLRPSGTVSVYLQFREFSGTFVEHCHNTVHEDHAMLLRWDVNGGPTPLPNPVSTPAGCTFVPSELLPEGA